MNRNYPMRTGNKEKVLIIANLWPPNSTTGVYRTVGLVEHLSDWGYEPILVTQNWAYTSEDKKTFVKETFDNYEVYKVNFDLKSRKINATLTDKKWVIVRKIYNLIDKLFWNLGIWWFQDYRKMLHVSKEIVANDRSIKKAIVISDPFQLYFIGYKLQRQFGLKWIADYRDAWNTVEFNDSFNYEGNRLNIWLKKLESLIEKKWVGTASFVTGVSDYYSQKISKFVKVPFKTIYNGFFLAELQQYKPSSKFKKEMLIVYNGSLYPKQLIEPFLSGLVAFITLNPDAAISVRFVGITVFPEAVEKINSALKGFEAYYAIIPRVSKPELIQEINNGDILLHITLGPQYKGAISSKIFDYLAAAKPVLCIPSDNEVVEQLLTESGQGFFANNSDEVADLLQHLYTEFTNKGRIDFNYNKDAVLKYSRENQTRSMAALLDKM